MNLASIRWDFDPIVFKWNFYGDKHLQVAWYGVLFAAGFLIGYHIYEWMCKREGRKTDDLDGLLQYLFIGTIVGARLGHCLFYEPKRFLGNPMEILYVWQGGLASHGGTIGVLLALFLYARSRKIELGWLVDRVSIPTALTAAMIRFGNLLNSEIEGDPTDLPWGVIFVRRVEELGLAPRHPAQLYESLCYFTLFGVLLWLYYKRGPQLKSWFITGLFLTWIFGSRFLIEFVKTPQESSEMMFGPLHMGHYLSIPFIILGVWLMLRKDSVATPVSGKG